MSEVNGYSNRLNILKLILTYSKIPMYIETVVLTWLVFVLLHYSSRRLEPVVSAVCFNHVSRLM